MSRRTTVHFVVTLKARAASANWDQVLGLLNGCLTSIFNQTSDDFRVLIACTDPPPTRFADDHRLTIRSAGFPLPTTADEKDADKRAKLIMGQAWLKEAGGGYLMAVDYDDRLSKRIVEAVVSGRPRHGYLFHDGYELVRGRGNLVRVPRLPARPFEWLRLDRRFYSLHVPFHRVCGTCAVIDFPAEALPAADAGSDPRAHALGLLAEVARVAADQGDPAADPRWPLRFILNHAAWKELSEQVGRPLDLLPFPGAVYITDTGDNLGKQQNSVGARFQLVRDIWPGRKVSTRQRSEFALWSPG